MCTPTGVSKGFMTPEYICKVNAKGEVLEANEGFRPSSEVKMHMRIYQERPDVNAVVHAHPMYATTFAIAGEALMDPIMPEAVIFLGGVPLAKIRDTIYDGNPGFYSGIFTGLRCSAFRKSWCPLHIPIPY